MRVGSLVYATDQGLGILARSFFAEGILTDVVIVRHASRTTHEEWYPAGTEVISARNRSADWPVIQRLLDRIDVFLAFETPFYWEIFKEAKKRGAPTFLMPMYECMPVVLPYQPDYIVNPSLLDQRYYPQGTFIPVPVKVPYRLRTKVTTYIHNAGFGGLLNRNGTGVLLDGIRLSKAPFRFILRSQRALPWNVEDPRIDYRIGTFPAENLWDEGDAFVFPETFNGLSLPLQEAFASGMLVVSTNRFPTNTWLPREPLIPCAVNRRNRISPHCNEFDEATVDPKELAYTLDYWYGKSIEGFSVKGRVFAEENSWEVLKPRYLGLITKSLRGARGSQNV